MIEIREIKTKKFSALFSVPGSRTGTAGYWPLNPFQTYTEDLQNWDKSSLIQRDQ